MTMTLPAAVAETHSAVLFFLGDRAYKLKKPVDLGFLDFRSREAREAVCHREVDLNRRLAPDVYLGVADVIGPDGAPCDHLVVMRRMPDGQRLTSLVRSGQPVEDHLWRVAHLMAAFHARSTQSLEADLAAGVFAARARWDANTTALIGMAARIFDEGAIALVHGLAGRYLDGRESLFEHRVADGRAVDGHGDLLADDIFCLEDGPRVLDCLEFDDGLRLGDGLADVAFLAMDLERIGRPELGRYFLDSYREHRGDAWPTSLAHHQIAYRAQVRAKVMAIRSEQGDEQAATEARSLLALAASHLEVGRVRLVLVGGLPGTGKSTLAASLAEALDATVLRADELRKELAGIPPARSAVLAFGEGIYSDASTSRTYETMLDRARIALGMGETVVLDASWTSGAWRDRARAVAAATSADLVEFRCAASVATTSRRILRRAATGDDPSDATPEIAAAMSAHAEPWPQATTIDTEAASAEALALALRHTQHHLGAVEPLVRVDGGTYGSQDMTFGPAPGRGRQSRSERTD